MTANISAIRHIERHALVHGDTVAIAYEEDNVTFAELYTVAGRYAAGLRADGVGPGDRVCYAGHNSVTFLVTYFAAIWVGAAFVPLNFRLAGPEIRAVLRDARPDVLVAEPAQAATIDEFLEGLSVRRALLVDDDRFITDTSSVGDAWESYHRFRTAHTTSPDHVPQHEDDLAALLYTSGSTGKSKGVMLTHGNLWWNWVNVDTVVDTRTDDVSLAVAPLFHIGGFNAVSLRTIVRGGTLVVRRTFNPAQVVDDLVHRRVNSMFLVPAMLAAIQKQDNFAAADLSALRSTIVAGAPVPPALIETYAEKGVFLQQAWGLTETAPFATYLEAVQTTVKIGSCGTPMPYSHAKVVDPETGKEITEPGTTGELMVSGPNVSQGYWNNPEATAAAFTSDGWFHTGDLGYVDSDGYFFIVDRLKDMIISGGENIYPAEIENALNSHPDIAEAAVVGLPHPKWGESVCAVVTFEDEDEELSLEEIRDYLGERIARYKLPSRLVAIDVIPRNGVGKLDKPRIRQQLAERGDSIAPTPPYTEAIQLPRQ